MFDRLFSDEEINKGWFDPQAQSKSLIDDSRIGKEVSRNSNVNSKDVERVKSSLFDAGYYEPNIDIGETPNKMSSYPDDNLFESIKGYQIDNRLIADGIIKPNGETANSFVEQTREMKDADKGKIRVVTAELKDSDEVPAMHDLDSSSNEGGDAEVSGVSEVDDSNEGGESRDDVSDGNDGEEQDIVEGMMDDIKVNEGMEPHAYLDTKGNITTGAGKNIDGTRDPHNTFMNQPWQNSEVSSATEEQKQEYWDYLQGEKDNAVRDENGNIDNNNQANSYEDKENGLHLSEEYIEQQAKEHMEQNIQDLKVKLDKDDIDFDKLSRSVQEGLLDMEYNMGNKFNREKWAEFFFAMDNHDSEGMARESHGRDVGEGRNKWRADKFLNAR
jgi:GH24 family phage-related lysozyme (muramidase)